MMKLEEITKELKVQDTTKLLAVIKNLEETGIIFRDKKGRYTLITNTNLKRGLIKITKKKGPIVIFEDKTETVVTYKDHKTLENNDIVLVDISNNIAKVVKIIRREHHNFIAEVIKDEHGYIITAALDTANIFDANGAFISANLSKLSFSLAFLK